MMHKVMGTDFIIYISLLKQEQANVCSNSASALAVQYMRC